MNQRHTQAFDPHALRRPTAFPWPVEDVQFIETHISWLYLAGDRVLKIRRPVRYPFVDHRTPESRKRSCLQEFALNRRLTTGVYLDVVPITRQGEGVQVDGTGEIIEWGTVMRRLPADRMLDRLIAANAVEAGLAERIGATLRRFHECAPVCATEKTAADQQSSVILGNIEELHHIGNRQISDQQLRQIAMVVGQFLNSQRIMLESRATGGWIRDGHGDLRTDHICVENDGTLQIFDCIEFNDALRCSDIASDLAFLLMDMRRLDRNDLADAILEGYDAPPEMLPSSLLRLYETHRALVRVKTESLTATSSSADAPLHFSSAARYLDTAFRSAIETGASLMVMTGLSGTGKSTIAGKIAYATGASWLRTDDLRAAISPGLPIRDAAWLEGAYAPEQTARTYAELFRSAREVLGAGKPVVLDGAFLDQQLREGAASVGRQAGVPVVLLETTLPESTVRERLDARASEGRDPSAATYGTYLRQRQATAGADLRAPEGVDHLKIDMTEPPGRPLEAFWSWLERRQLVYSGLDVGSP
ncbi:MAG: AAA family ATPase [Thermomicrobiales bacterium]